MFKKALNLKMKLNIIDKIRKGARMFFPTKELDLPISTVSTVWCKMENFEALNNNLIDGELLNVIRQRDSRMEKMETMLCAWLEDRTQRCQPLSQALICDKAVLLYKSL